MIKNAVDQMWSAYREFENALKAGEDGYQAELTGSAPFIVEVATNEGRKSAATFAGKIAAELLGFRPTRHVPAEAGDTLVVAVEEDLDEATDSE